MKLYCFSLMKDKLKNKTIENIWQDENVYLLTN